MGDFKSLGVWRRAHQFVLDVYIVTATFPRAERFGITNQMRRAAVSIPANIAEGSRRGSDRDMARFCQIALGSAAETEYYLILTHDLDFIPRAEQHRLNEMLQEVMRMLNGLIRSLRTRDPRPATRD